MSLAIEGLVNSMLERTLCVCHSKKIDGTHSLGPTLRESLHIWLLLALSVTLCESSRQSV
jgi:hypothetical protein